MFTPLALRQVHRDTVCWLYWLINLMASLAYATMLAMQVGDGRVPALVAACLALVAGSCSVARLNPTLKKLSSRDMRDVE